MSRAARHPEPSGGQSPFAPLALAGYLGCGLIVVEQALQIGVTVQGMGDDPATLRFQFATSLAARLSPLVLGVLMVWGAALVSGKRTGIRSLAGVMSGGLGLLLLVTGLSMWFDGASVRPTLGADELAPFVAQWIRGLLLSGLGVVYLGWVVLGLRKAP
ncbi:MAG: hypothetical protein ACKVZ0_21905 [Gemmatimonadales bacterium]